MPSFRLNFLLIVLYDGTGTAGHWSAAQNRVPLRRRSKRRTAIQRGNECAYSPPESIAEIVKDVRSLSDKNSTQPPL